MALPKYFPMLAPGGKTEQMPSVGFGTWASGGPNTPRPGDWVKKAVLAALEAGCRHLDCAWAYGVDHEIGEAIRESGIPRSELFITSKFWNNFAAPEAVQISLDKILADMRLEYLDLFLAHWPIAFEPTSLEGLKNARSTHGSTTADKGIRTGPDGMEMIDWKHTSEPIAKAAGHPDGSFLPTWNAMKKLVQTRKVRAIGVSNFGIADLKAVISHADPEDVPISCNQVEVHPWLPNTDLIEFCRKHGIITSCYSPFAGQQKDGSTLIKDETVQKLAKKNSMDVGQLLQSWAVQRGTVPLGKSQTASRIKSNIDVRRLSDEDIQALNDLAIPNGQGRTVDFTDEWGVKLYQN